MKGSDHLEDLAVDGKVILEWILVKYGEGVWTGFIWLRGGRALVNTVMSLLFS
jgi:hypothetical protein